MPFFLRWANCELLFQLSAQVAAKGNAATKESSKDTFFDEHICICEEDFEEYIPPGAVECEQSECADRRMMEWDSQMQNVTCICDDEEDDEDDDQSLNDSSSEEGMHTNQIKSN